MSAGLAAFNFVADMAHDISMAGINQHMYEMNARVNYDMSRKLAQYQNDLAMQNWNTMNEYNSPKAQMERYMEAGLNPNLMYGQGSPGNAGSPPDAHHVGQYQQQAAQLQLRNSAADYMLKAAQVEQMETSIKGQQIRNSEESIKLDNVVRKWNAIQTFKYDKTKGPKDHVVLYGVTEDGRVYSYYSDENNDYYKFFRNTPEYKELDLMWQKGELNEHNINLLSQQEDLRSRTANTNAAYDRVLSGEGSLEDWLRVIGEFFIKILGGVGGSWTNGPKNPGTTITF